MKGLFYSATKKRAEKLRGQLQIYGSSFNTEELAFLSANGIVDDKTLEMCAMSHVIDDWKSESKYPNVMTYVKLTNIRDSMVKPQALTIVTKQPGSPVDAQKEPTTSKFVLVSNTVEDVRSETSQMSPLHSSTYDSFLNDEFPTQLYREKFRLNNCMGPAGLCPGGWRQFIARSVKGRCHFAVTMRSFAKTNNVALPDDNDCIWVWAYGYKVELDAVRDALTPLPNSPVQWFLSPRVSACVTTLAGDTDRYWSKRGSTDPGSYIVANTHNSANDGPDTPEELVKACRVEGLYYRM